VTNWRENHPQVKTNQAWHMWPILIQ